MLLPEKTYRERWSSLQSAFNDRRVDELLLNRFDLAWLLQGKVQKAWSSPFESESEYLDWLLDFAYRREVRLDPRQGSAGGYLTESQLRWHVLLPPLAVDGPLLSLRRHRFASLDLNAFSLIPADSARLAATLREPGVILVCGPTGSGKTTFLSALLAAFCQQERVLILESLPELDLSSRKWVRLAERGMEIDGQGGFPLQRLFEEALRLRPDRLVVGEIRSQEAKVLVQAMATGHGAVLSSLHASDANTAIRRLESLCGPASGDLSFFPVTIVMMEGQGKPRVREVWTRPPLPSTSYRRELLRIF